jgi:hypothetical protein
MKEEPLAPGSTWDDKRVGVGVRAEGFATGK